MAVALVVLVHVAVVVVVVVMVVVVVVIVIVGSVPANAGGHADECEGRRFPGRLAALRGRPGHRAMNVSRRKTAGTRGQGSKQQHHTEAGEQQAARHAERPVDVLGRQRLGGGEQGAEDEDGDGVGRRVGDDVIDISLRVVAGVLDPAFNKAPNNALTDGVDGSDQAYLTSFPYLGTPYQGYDGNNEGRDGDAGMPADRRPRLKRVVVSAAAALCLAVPLAGSAGAQSVLDPNDPCPTGVPAPAAPFGDRSTAGQVHLRNIDCAAAWRIVLGGAGGVAGRYFPTAPVRRDQMASFIFRALELPDASGDARGTTCRAAGHSSRTSRPTTRTPPPSARCGRPASCSARATAPMGRGT